MDCLGSHNLIKLSFDPLTINPKSGCQSQLLTSQLWPFNILSSLPLLKFQIFRIESSPQVKISDHLEKMQYL